MRPSFAVLLLVIFFLSGGTTLQRVAHMYGGEAPEPLLFQYRDGGSGIYYSVIVGNAADRDAATDTVVFFYGGTGCLSWKSVMPGYVDGLAAGTRVFVLNKRFVSDRSTGLFDCGRDFKRANNPEQWVADYSEFIAARIAALESRPGNVVLVGVSEGALPAAGVAGRSPLVTHLAIIGSGGYSMRRSLRTLERRGAVMFDIDFGWEKISANPRSIEDDWYGNPYRWWADIMDIDPLADLLKLDISILVGIGEADESVPAESARFLESEFKKAGKKNLVLEIYPGADHRLYGDGISHRGEFFARLSRLLQQPTSDNATQ